MSLHAFMHVHVLWTPPSAPVDPSTLARSRSSMNWDFRNRIITLRHYDHTHIDHTNHIDHINTTD